MQNPRLFILFIFVSLLKFFCSGWIVVSSLGSSGRKRNNHRSFPVFFLVLKWTCLPLRIDFVLHCFCFVFFSKMKVYCTYGTPFPKCYFLYSDCLQKQSSLSTPHLYNNILIALQPQKLFICTFVMSTRISVTCTEDKKMDRYRCKKK